MLVSEILKTIRPAYCNSWDEVFTSFRDDPHEWRRVQELMGEIKDRGISQPGRIDFHERDEEDSDDLEDYYYLGNGTHRFAAHVELGLDEFPVVFGDSSGDDETTSYTNTEVKFSFLSEKFTHEVRDKVFDCIGSSVNFRVNDEAWAEYCMMSGTGSGSLYEVTLMLYPISESLHNEFLKKLLSRITCCVPRDALEYLSIGNVTEIHESFWADSLGVTQDSI